MESSTRGAWYSRTVSAPIPMTAKRYEQQTAVAFFVFGFLFPQGVARIRTLQQKALIYFRDRQTSMGTLTAEASAH